VFLLVVFNRSSRKLKKRSSKKPSSNPKPSSTNAVAPTSDPSPPSIQPVNPPEGNPSVSIIELAKTIRASTDIFLDAETTTLIRGLSSQSTKHVNTTAREVARFFDILSCSPILGVLTDSVDDPEANDPTKRFYLMLRGDASPAKKATLNACLVFYAQALKKVGSSDVQLGSHDLKEVAMSEYQPNTLEKIHKQLFAEFRRNSIYLQQRDFKHFGAGSYKAYWKTRMAATVEHRDDYGRLPNRSTYDVNEEWKLRNKASPPWDFTNFKDLMWLFTFRVMTDYMLRGAKEVRLYSIGVLFRTICF
jgi:hypothetical protein